jgi:hypothetical protein
MINLLLWLLRVQFASAQAARCESVYGEGVPGGADDVRRAAKMQDCLFSEGGLDAGVRC